MQLKKLREIRQSNKLRVADLAAASGLTTQHVYGLERGVSNASYSTALLLALLLGVPVGQLTGEGQEVGSA